MSSARGHLATTLQGEGKNGLNLISRRVSIGVVRCRTACVTQSNILAVHDRVGHTAVVPELVHFHTLEITKWETGEDRTAVQKTGRLQRYSGHRIDNIRPGKAQYTSARAEQGGENRSILVEHHRAQAVRDHRAAEKPARRQMYSPRPAPGPSRTMARLFWNVS